MAHIEQTSLLPRPLMTLNMTEILILQGHREPRKGHHLGPIGDMEIVQLGSLRRRLRYRRGISYCVPWKCRRSSRSHSGKWLLSDSAELPSEQEGRAIGGYADGCAAYGPRSEESSTSPECLHSANIIFLYAPSRELLHWRRRSRKSPMALNAEAEIDNGKVTW